MMAGLNTHIVTVAHATEKPTADSPYMPGFLEVTNDNFGVEMVAADKGYLSKANYRAINDLGASGYIPFKSNSTAHSGHHKRDYVWEAAYHLFASHRADFDPNYHQRSNAETVFHMIKAKYGPMVRCRLPDAQVNEVMLKVLCHNLRVLVKVAFEYDCTQLLGPKPFDTMALALAIKSTTLLGGDEHPKLILIEVLNGYTAFWTPIYMGDLVDETHGGGKLLRVESMVQGSPRKPELGEVPGVLWFYWWFCRLLRNQLGRMANAPHGKNQTIRGGSLKRREAGSSRRIKTLSSFGGEPPSSGGSPT